MLCFVAVVVVHLVVVVAVVGILGFVVEGSFDFVDIEVGVVGIEAVAVDIVDIGTEVGILDFVEGHIDYKMAVGFGEVDIRHYSPDFAGFDKLLLSQEQHLGLQKVGKLERCRKVEVVVAVVDNWGQWIVVVDEKCYRNEERSQHQVVHQGIWSNSHSFVDFVGPRIV